MPRLSPRNEREFTATKAKPSDILILGIWCLLETEKCKNYLVNMGYYHEPRVYKGKTRTMVSLTGCIGFVCFGWSCERVVRYQEMSQMCNRKFHGLELLNWGNIKYGLQFMGIPHPDGLPAYLHCDESWKSYHRDRATWFNQMRKLVKTLQSKGL